VFGFVLDRDIRDMRYDAAFMEKAKERFHNGDGYSRRFVYQHSVYKFCQRGNGEWLLYRESNGPRQQTLMQMSEVG